MSEPVQCVSDSEARVAALIRIEEEYGSMNCEGKMEFCSGGGLCDGIGDDLVYRANACAALKMLITGKPHTFTGNATCIAMQGCDGELTVVETDDDNPLNFDRCSNDNKTLAEKLAARLNLLIDGAPEFPKFSAVREDYGIFCSGDFSVRYEMPAYSPPVVEGNEA